MNSWIVLGLAIAANIAANISFKHFIQTTPLTLSWSGLLNAVLQPSLWIGGCLGFALLGGYLYSLRDLPLSIAYTAATSLSIAGITCAGVFIYGETLSLQTLFGIGVVLAGVVMMATG